MIAAMSAPLEALRNVPLFADPRGGGPRAARAAAARAPLPRRRRGHDRGLDRRRLLRHRGRERRGAASAGEHRATLGPGDHFGEIALIDDGVRSASIVGRDRPPLLRADALGVPPVRGGAPAGRLGPPAGARAPHPRGAGERQLSSARVNGTEIAYEAAGAGPPVVLLHAGVGDRRLWDGQVDALAPSTSSSVPTCAAGASRRSRAGRSPSWTTCAALLDVARHRDARRSWRTRSAAGWRSTSPSPTPSAPRALVLIAPRSHRLGGLARAGRLRRGGGRAPRRGPGRRGRRAQPPHLARRPRPRPPPRSPPETRGARRRDAAPRFRARRSPPTRPRRRRSRAAGATRPRRRGSARSPSRRSSSPAPTTSRPSGRSPSALAAEIPNAEGALIETAHLPGLERPDELSRLVLDFLASAARLAGRLCCPGPQGR